MPIYEFTCRTCQTLFESRVARVGDRPQACPACGSSDLEKVLSTFAAHTSGGGKKSEVTPCELGEACGRLTGRCGATD